MAVGGLVGHRFLPSACPVRVLSPMENPNAGMKTMDSMDSTMLLMASSSSPQATDHEYEEGESEYVQGKLQGPGQAEFDQACDEVAVSFVLTGNQIVSVRCCDGQR
jgi:hypothetical protein